MPRGPLVATRRATWHCPRQLPPAMAVTLVGFFVARFTFQWVVRPRLVDTVTVTRPLTMFGPPDDQAATAGAWVLSSSTVDGAGHVVPSGAADRMLAEACNLTRTSSEASYMRCSDCGQRHRHERHRRPPLGAGPGTPAGRAMHAHGGRGSQRWWVTKPSSGDARDCRVAHRGRALPPSGSRAMSRVVDGIPSQTPGPRRPPRRGARRPRGQQRLRQSFCPRARRGFQALDATDWRATRR